MIKTFMTSDAYMSVATERGITKPSDGVTPGVASDNTEKEFEKDGKNDSMSFQLAKM